VFESIEDIMDRYFKLRKSGEDHSEAINKIMDVFYPLNEPRNEETRKKIVYLLSTSFILYPESEQIKYVIKFIILNRNKGIKEKSKDDHEINRKLYKTYEALKKKYKVHIDEPREDIDCLGFWEALV
jgi:hypothetical protein